MSLTMRVRRAAAAGALVLAAAVAACGGDGSSTDEPADGLSVVASFYPLQFVVERVGGPHVTVTNLTPAGAEPHDVELTPRDIATIAEADLVVYLAGFAAAVDDAVAQSGADAVDAGEVVHLEERDGVVDPHFWLDPTRLADVVGPVEAQLAELDPAHAADYAANAAALTEDLAALDGALAEGLASCDRRDLVTSHAAFGYLAARYDLHQVGVAGLSPHEEPSPQSLADIADFVREQDVTTIFMETLVDPAIAETIAAETGAAVAVLDPLEGLAADASGDYVTVMHSNLETLREGLSCR